MSDHEAKVRRFARILSKISHTLESTDNRLGRVERCLDLTRKIIPSDRCALLEVHDDVTTLYASPLQRRDERAGCLALSRRRSRARGGHRSPRNAAAPRCRR